MNHDVIFPEIDWKALRSMKDTILRRASTRALEHVESIVTNRQDDPHKTYIALFRALETEDKKISRMFDDMKRSNALEKIAAMIRYNLITEEELGAFTAETAAKAREWAGANQAMKPTGAIGKRQMTVRG
jgi:heme oxygenase